MSDDEIKIQELQEGDPNTTGHIWDGIREFDNPMPRWWLWTFYATIVWGVLYSIAYPAWPMLNSATSGLLGYSTRAEVGEDIAAVKAANAEINARLTTVELSEIAADPALLDYAVQAGGAVFHTWCAQCHGEGGAGVQADGYPNLLDDDWLWGGTLEDIRLTVAHGIRTEEDLDARFSQMPAYGEFFSDEEISQVVNFAMTLSGTEPDDTAQVQAGSVLFAENCAACHMEDGSGDRTQGAPNLTDAIWLYGGDYDRLVETVTYSRYGVMPAWLERLGEAQVRAVATYIHTRGGGE